MGEIRRYRRKYRYPTGASGVPGDASALSEQRAISRFAETMSIFSGAEGRRIMRADEEAQTISGIAEMERLLNSTFDTFDSNNKEDEYLPAYQKTEKSFDALIKGYSNKNAQKGLQLFREKNKPKWENSVNDAVLQRKQVNAIDSSGRIIDSINDLDLTDPSARAEADGRIGAAGNLRKETGLYSDNAVESWTEEALKNVDNRAIYQQAENILEVQGYDKAIDFVMNKKIEADDKKGIVNDIKFKAAQQQLKYDAYVEKTEQEFYSKYDKEQLAFDEIEASGLSASKKLMWRRLVDAQAEARLSGEVELNWESYDRLQSMVEDYDTGKISKEKVQEAISKEVGKTIPTTIARSLRDRLAIKDDPANPLNKSSAKRALSILNELKGDDFFWPENIEGDDPEGKRQNLLNYLKITKEFEKYLTDSPDATDEQINDKVDTLTKPYIEKKATRLFETLGKWLRPKETTPFWRHFGTTEEAALARKKAKAGIEETKKLTPEIARQYLNMAGGDRKRAEELAKDAGYEW